MDEDELLRRLLARRLLVQMLGRTSAEAAVNTGNIVVHGQPLQQPFFPSPEPQRNKRGASTSKTLAQQGAARTGVGVETAPPERVRPNLPVSPGSGVSGIEHTSRPLTPAELFRHLGR